MNRSRTKLVNENNYRGYSINSGQEGKYPLNKRTINQVIDMIEYMTEYHSKVLCCRLDIHQPSWSDIPIRSLMFRIMERIKRKLESEFRDSRNQFDMCHVWVAESNSESHEHIHCLILVNGNVCHNAWRIYAIANDVVKSIYGIEYDGLVYFCNSNGRYGIQIDRNSVDYEQQINAAVYAGSYLAKTTYDHNRPKYARAFSASRLPRG